MNEIHTCTDCVVLEGVRMEFVDLKGGEDGTPPCLGRGESGTPSFGG